MEWGEGAEPEATKSPEAKHLWVVCLPLSYFFSSPLSVMLQDFLYNPFWTHPAGFYDWL